MVSRKKLKANTTADPSSEESTASRTPSRRPGKKIVTISKTKKSRIVEPHSSDDSSSEELRSSRTPTRRSGNKSRLITPNSSDDSSEQSQAASSKTPTRRSGKQQKDITIRKRKKTRMVDISVGTKQVRVSVKLIKEIKKLQQWTKNIMPKLPFAKLVHEIMQERGQFRIQMQALEGLQIAAEMFMTQVFEDTNRCAIHAKRVTIKPSDMQLVANLGSRYDPVFQCICNT